MTQPTSSPLSSWFERRSRWIFWGLLILSLATRAVYVVQFSGSPLTEWHRWSDSDMAFFDEWSRDIAKGNWLQRQPRHPLHSWHVVLANAYFEQGGSGRPPNVSDEIAAKTLWNRWYGGVRFHQEPLYVYLLAILHSLTGHAIAVMLGLQLVAGVVSVLLIWDITRRCFGPAAALIAGLLAALSPTLLYLDLVLLRESFITCAGLGLVWLTLRAMASGKLRDYAILGFAAGVTLLLKATLVLFIAGVVATCVLRLRRDKSAKLQLAAMVGMACVGVLPAVIRNLAVGAPTFSLSSVATITFINTNAFESAPRGFPVNDAVAPRIMSESHGSLAQAMRLTWATHTPGSLAKFYWAKWSGLWQGFEAPDNISFGFFQTQTPILRWLPFTFTILSPLALVGLLLSVCCDRQRPPGVNAEEPARAPIWPLWLLAGNYVIALMLFTQVGRLRVPLVAALVPFAAFAIVQVHDWLWSSRIKGAALLAVFGLVTAWTLNDTPRGLAEFRAADFNTMYQLYYNPRIEAAVQQEDWPGAANLLRRSLRSEPQPVRELTSGASVQSKEEADLVELFAAVRSSLAIALTQSNQPGEAANERQRSAELLAIARKRPTNQ